MSFVAIPNLLSLRNTRTRARGGFRGRERGDNGEAYSQVIDDDPEIVKAQKDLIVQQTDQDANLSRMSAVDAGYLTDPFAKEFATPGGQKRYPIINRGTYARTTAIDRLVNDFLSSQPTTRKQIISLGAGTDTRFFRLALASPDHPPNFLYHELDFPINTERKIAAIHKSPALAHQLGDSAFVRSTDYELHTPNYHIHALDLRTLHPSHVVESGPGTLRHIDPQLPTMLISECCLIYLTPSAADNVALYFTAHFFPPSTPLGLVLYEPIKPEDSFGRVMVANLAARGIVLQTLQRYSSLALQRARLVDYGLRDGGGAVDLDFLMEEWIAAEEKVRVRGVEMLDEVEELNLLARHYCVVWGWRNGNGNGKGEGNEVWEGWKALKGQDD